MGEHGDPTRNHMPPGLLAMEIKGDGGRVALAVHRTNKRFNRIRRFPWQPIFRKVQSSTATSFTTRCFFSRTLQ